MKKHPLQNRTNVQIKGGGGQRPFEQCSKKLHFFERVASLTALALSVRRLFGPARFARGLDKKYLSGLMLQLFVYFAKKNDDVCLVIKYLILHIPYLSKVGSNF